MNVTAEMVDLAVLAYEPRGADPRRSAEIILRSALGETLTSIGERFGITRERARQIVSRYEKRVGHSVRGVFSVAGDRTPKMYDDFDRFIEKVRVDHETGCWNWTAAINPKSGYAVFIGLGEQYGHRFSVRFFKGMDAYAAGDRLHTDHLCRNRKCVNPDHLEVVTCAENLSRSPRWVEGRGWEWNEPSWSDDQMLAMLRWLAVKLGHTPGFREIDIHLPFSAGHAHRRFGSTVIFQKAAGLSANRGSVHSPLPLKFVDAFAYLSAFATAEEAAESVAAAAEAA